MSRRSKLKDMAAAGNPWAIEMLAKMQAQGRNAASRKLAMKRGKATRDAADLRDAERLGERMARDRDPPNPVFSEAMRDAADIREWTDGPRPASWRIYRLAQALTGPVKRVV